MKAAESEKIRKDRLAMAGVVQFFLEVYKFQLRVPTSAQARYMRVEPPYAQKDYTYELSVKKKDTFETRRITIGLIGEGSGSRSRCFKVAYDDLIVIKIPPRPILSFYEYVERIRAERRILENHSNVIQFISPTVSALLKRLQPFTEEAMPDPIELEDRYIDWLEQNPEYHRYLKINGSYVFFMDLSAYAFLGKVLHRMHDVSAAVREEILRHPNPLWDSQAFETAYGSGGNLKRNAIINERVQAIFDAYEGAMLALYRKYDLPPASGYELQKWFLRPLAGMPPDKSAFEGSGSLRSALVSLINKTMETHKRALNAYRGMVRAHVKDVCFHRNIPKMRGLVTNMLELLTALHQSGVAMRDLKPDNVFVAGNPEKHPYYLASAEQYSLGLIDLETGVAFSRDSECDVDQPLLGGTPSYATPSHLFSNRLLIRLYPNIRRIFYLQDWYAILGMIYETVTGERLFDKTRQILSQIKHISHSTVDRHKSAAEVLHEYNRMFWESASQELHAKLELQQEKLNAVDLELPKTARKVLTQYLLKIRRNLVRKIRRAMANQGFFGDEQSQQHIIECSMAEFCHEKEKWGFAAEHAGEAGAVMMNPIVQTLVDLEPLKKELSVLESTIHKVVRTKPPITVYELLKTLYLIIMTYMYHAESGPKVVKAPRKKNNYPI